MMSLRVAAKATFVLALLAVATTQGKQDKQLSQLSSALANTESNGIRPFFNDVDRDILVHLRRIVPVQSPTPSPSTSTEIRGYFYAQYYSQEKCSSGTGSVSYVEGYATGLCFQKSDGKSGMPSGSMTQTCNPQDQSVIIQSYESLNCTGASIMASFSTNGCDNTASKYGFSVDMKCSMDPSKLPLQNDAIVQSSYSSSDDVCDGAPQAFKAFIKSECQPNQLSGVTKTFTCPDQKSTYHLSGSCNGACASSSEFSNSSILSNSCESASGMKDTIKPVGLYETLKKVKTVCSAQCADFRDSCLATRHPSSEPSVNAPASLASRVLKRSRTRSVQPTRSRGSDDDAPPISGDDDVPSPSWQPTSQPQRPSHRPNRRPSFHPSAQPSTTAIVDTHQPTSLPSEAATEKPSARNHPKRTAKPSNHPFHRAIPHNSKKPISPPETPSCEGLYKACVARCPIVLPYTVYEAYQQFNCFTAESPTAAPSFPSHTKMRNPTVAPTTAKVSTVNVVQEISGVSVETARSVDFIFAFKKSTIAAMRLTISVNDLQITRVAANTPGRKLLTEGVTISSVIIVTNTNVTQLSMSLNEAIQSGAFTEVMVKSGYPTAVAELPALMVDASTRPPSGLPPTLTTTNAWQPSLALSDSAIIGITVGSFVLLCILSSSIVFYCARSKSGYNGPEEVGVSYYADDRHFDDMINQKNDVDAFDHSRGIDQSGRGRL